MSRYTLWTAVSNVNQMPYYALIDAE